MIQVATSIEQMIAVPEDHHLSLPIVLIQGTQTLELKTEQPTQGAVDYWPLLAKRIQMAMTKGADIEFGTQLGALANLNSGIAATAFPTLHLQGKGIIFDIKEDGVISQRQYKPYLMRLQKGLAKMIKEAPQTKADHSKNAPITARETAINLAMATDNEDPMMPVAEHEDIMSSHTRTLLATGELMRRQLLVVAEAIQQEARHVNGERVLLSSLCCSLYKMLGLKEIPQDNEVGKGKGKEKVKEEDVSDDGFMAIPAMMATPPMVAPPGNTIPFTPVNPQSSSNTDELSITGVTVANRNPPPFPLVPSLFLEAIEGTHACICPQRDPEGYEKVLAVAKEEFEAKLDVDVMEAYKDTLLKQYGAEWTKKAKDEAMAKGARTDESVEKEIQTPLVKQKKELSEDALFIGESHYKLLQKTYQK